MAYSSGSGNINFIRIVNILKDLRDSGLITAEEYAHAKEYYRKMTGADIAVCD